MEGRHRKYFGIMYKGDDIDPVYFKSIGITKCEQMREDEIVRAVIGIKSTSRPHKVEQCAITAGLVLQPIDGQLVCTFGDAWPVSSHWFYQTVKQHESYKVWTTEIKNNSPKVFAVKYEGSELAIDCIELLQARDNDGIVYCIMTMNSDTRVQHVRDLLSDRKLHKVGAHDVYLFKGFQSYKKHSHYHKIMELKASQ